MAAVALERCHYSVWEVAATATGTVSSSVSTSGHVPASATSPEATAAPSATTTHSGNVGPLWSHLDIAAFKHTVIEHECLGNQGWLGKFDVGIPGARQYVFESRVWIGILPFGLASEFIQKNGNAIDGSAALEVSLDIFWRC